jgi:hypothetical protein
MLAAPLAAAAEPQKIISYVRAKPASDIDAHASFGWDVLRVVLEKTRPAFGDYSYTTTPDAEQALRFRHARKSSDVQVNVVVLTTSPDWSDYLAPVRIPLLRGLLGYRLILIHRRDLDRFAKINDLEALRKIRFGSVKHWSDTIIMKNAGLNVVTGTTYDGLHKMMQADRFDALSRGAHQIEAEMAALNADPANDLVVEPHLMLHYTLPVYFWFTRDKEGRRRAERVEAGLKMMVEDGTLEKMFNATFEASIEKYDLAHRTVIELANPLLIPEDPVDDRKLWYKPTGK